MKRSFILTLVIGLIVAGVACKIVDPFLIALNIPLQVSALLNGGSSWNESKTFTIQDEIKNVNTSYVGKIKATRVSDITISMPNPPSSGTATGIVAYQLDGGPIDTLATFTNVPFSSLKTPGISLTNPLITYNVPALVALLGALQNPTGLPTALTVTVQTSGTTSVTVPQNTEIVATIHFQADVSI